MYVSNRCRQRPRPEFDTLPLHQAIREPFDYYRLGCDFAEGMVDDSRSLIVGLDQVEKMQKQIAAGDNVVLFANHQSEADPQIYSARSRFAAGVRAREALRACCAFGACCFWSVLCILERAAFWSVLPASEHPCPRCAHERRRHKRAAQLSREGPLDRVESCLQAP